MALTYVKESNFQQEVLEAEGTVLVDFFAAWCGPCRMMSPVIDQVAALHPEVKVCKLDIDSAQDLAVRFNVRSIPTLLVFRGGKVVNMSVGAISLAQVEALIK